MISSLMGNRSRVGNLQNKGIVNSGLACHVAKRASGMIALSLVHR